MQADTLSISAVPNLVDGTSVQEDYKRFEEAPNRSVYTQNGTTPDDKSTMTLYRTLGKRSGDSRGQNKSAIKFSRNFDVPNADGSGNISLPCIVEVSVSYPIGIAPLEYENMIGKASAFIGSFNGTIRDSILHDQFI